jgi:hypothetical protein
MNIIGLGYNFSIYYLQEMMMFTIVFIRIIDHYIVLILKKISIYVFTITKLAHKVNNYYCKGQKEI